MLSTADDTNNQKALYPKANHVIETLLGTGADKTSSVATQVINPTTTAHSHARISTDKKATQHAFNLLEHEIKNPLAAIQINQELLSDQLHLLNQQTLAGHIIQTPQYQAKLSAEQILGVSKSITQLSLQSVKHIGDVFEKVRLATGIFKQDTGKAAASLSQQAIDNQKTEAAFSLLEFGLKDPIVAIQTNQELMLEQLEALAQEALAGRLVTTQQYNGQTPLNNLLNNTVEITRCSLASLGHINEVFTNVKHLTGLFKPDGFKGNNDAPKLKPVRIKKLALQALEQCHDQFPSIKTTIECTIKDSLTIIGNESLLRQAFLNIIQNGYEALAQFKPQSPILTIKLNQVIYPSKAIVIEIYNNADAIPPEILPTIFEPYVSSKTTETPNDSQGLGLAIAKQIIEQHNGKVVCKSNNTEGTTFIVLLKL
jgi:signal transduction histidine kinase